MISQTLIIYILSALFFIAIGWQIRNEIRLKKIFKGKNGSDLEGILTQAVRDLEELKTARTGLQKNVTEIERRLGRSIRNIQTIRYNPFPDSGGNQSFVIALLNDLGDGVVISSLYARERISLFAKPIKNYTSEHELTEEEKEAISKARPS